AGPDSRAHPICEPGRTVPGEPQLAVAVHRGGFPRISLTWFGAGGGGGGVGRAPLAAPRCGRGEGGAYRHRAARPAQGGRGSLPPRHTTTLDSRRINSMNGRGAVVWDPSTPRPTIGERYCNSCGSETATTHLHRADRRHDQRSWTG